MAHPDEVVKPAEQVDSKLVAEAVQRQDAAGGDDATPQEKKQAAVEKAHALSTRPQGSYAQLHEVEEATLAVPDKEYRKELAGDAKDAKAASQPSK
jgi:hypothetical protein